MLGRDIVLRMRVCLLRVLIIAKMARQNLVELEELEDGDDDSEEE